MPSLSSVSPGITTRLSRSALHSHFAAAVQVVLHMRRLRGGARVLDVVGVPVRADGMVEVRSGLKIGETLAVRGAEALRTGVPVITGGGKDVKGGGGKGGGKAGAKEAAAGGPKKEKP